MSPLPLSSWFHPLLGAGAVYERGLHFLPEWTLFTALVAAGSYLVLRQWQPELNRPPVGWCDRVGQLLHAPLNFRHDWPWFTVGCALLLLATDYQGFTRGFFRWDDFSFIQATRENLPLPDLVMMYHNDHSMPLFRLWVSGLVAVAGPSASASELARVFNFVGYVTCLGVLLTGTALLAECTARRMTAVCFCLFAWFWSGWGEFTTGFYTLIAYPQTLVCGLLAITLLMRYLRAGALGWLFGGIVCALFGSGLDISGVWIFPAIGGFIWASGRAKDWTGRVLVSCLAIAFVVAAYYHLVWFRHPLTGRELIQNPTGEILGNGLLENGLVHFERIPFTVLSGMGGTLLSWFSPGFLGLTAARFYGDAWRSAPIYAVEGLALAGAGWLLWRHGARLSLIDRRLLASIVLPMFILIGMTSVARVHALDLPGSLWPAKYFCLPQVWGVLGAVFLLDRTALSFPSAAERAARWIVAAIIAGIWMLVTFWYLERALDINAARRPAGRQGNTAAALLRRTDFDTFQRNIVELSRRTGQKQLDVPSPSGLYWAHPYLEFGFDPVRGGTFLFTDLLSIAADTGITLRERPLAQVPHETLKTIEEIPSLKRVFDSTPPQP